MHNLESYLRIGFLSGAIKDQQNLNQDGFCRHTHRGTGRARSWNQQQQGLVLLDIILP